MSAVTPTAEILGCGWNVRFVLPVQPVDATLALNLPHAGLFGNKGKMTAY
jgi:hypothetical protein